MNISITPSQESLIITKLKTGKYKSIEEVLEVALRLLDEHDRAELEWINDIRQKMSEAIVVSEPPVQEETATDYTS